jgi:ribose transport system permease protein
MENGSLGATPGIERSLDSKANQSNRFRRLLKDQGWNVLGLPLVLVLMIIYFSSQSENFLTGSNMQNVGRAIAAVGLLAIGQAFVILLGQIDISVGAIVGMSTVTTALAVEAFGPVGFAAAPLTGVVIGLANGFIIASFAIHSVIVTIGTMTVVRGLAYVTTKGQPVTGDFPDVFRWIGEGYVGSIPVPFIILVIALLAAGFILRYTKLGPKLYAVGGNEEAARLAGLNVARVQVTAFVICGALAGIAGLILAARINSGQPNLGEGLELQAIAAAVVGGMALTGGRGTITGVALGILILTILQNGLDITNVSSYLQQVLSGIVILLAVIADSLRSRGAGGGRSFKIKRRGGGNPPPPAQGQASEALEGA